MYAGGISTFYMLTARSRRISSDTSHGRLGIRVNEPARVDTRECGVCTAVEIAREEAIVGVGHEVDEMRLRGRGTLLL